MHPPLDQISEPIRTAVDSYLAGTLDTAGLERLEALLGGDPAARAYFVHCTMMDRDLRLEARASLASDAVLARIGVGHSSSAAAVTDSPAAAVADTADGLRVPSTARPRNPMFGWAAAAAVLAAVGLGWMMARSIAPPHPLALRPPQPLIQLPDPGSVSPRPSPPRTRPDVAWLVNAQNCVWSGGVAPADLQPGNLVQIDRGLAELQFRSGARILLEGPARLELVSDNAARLHRGRLTGIVAGPIKGFEVLSPGGRVIDLGTQFGVSVGDTGQTDVYCFDGHVQAVTATSSGRPLDLHARDAFRFDAAGQPLTGLLGQLSPEQFVRHIVPQPLIEPRSLRANFGKAFSGTLSDASGYGTGLTHRLPGTGSHLGDRDANLTLNTTDEQLELTTTNSDINRQLGLDTGEYLGVRLAELGFTGHEDFEVQIFVPNIPALRDVGQFGLYAGSRSDRVIRGGLISRGREGPYTLFMTNNDGGRDVDSLFVGLFSMGDDLSIKLKRIDGKYALTVENLTTGSSNTLAIKHPAYLDAENDLYVGLFGANTASNVRRTLAIKAFSVTVWTRTGETKKGVENMADPPVSPN